MLKYHNVLTRHFLRERTSFGRFPHTLGLTMPHSRPVLNKRRRRHAKRWHRSERMQSASTQRASTRNENAQNAGRQAKRRHTEHRHANRRRAKRWHAKRKHAGRRQPEDDNRNHPLASPARFPPFRQEYRAENKPRNSQRRKNTERHAEAVRIDAQIAARSERHDPDEHRRKQRA